MYASVVARAIACSPVLAHGTYPERDGQWHITGHAVRLAHRQLGTHTWSAINKHDQRDKHNHVESIVYDEHHVDAAVQWL